MVAYTSEIFGNIPHLGFNRKLVVLFASFEKYDALQEFRERGRVVERLLALKKFWNQVRQTWQLPNLKRGAEEVRIYHCLRMPVRPMSGDNERRNKGVFCGETYLGEGKRDGLSAPGEDSRRTRVPAHSATKMKKSQLPLRVR